MKGKNIKYKVQKEKINNPENMLDGEKTNKKYKTSKDKISKKKK